MWFDPLRRRCHWKPVNECFAHYLITEQIKGTLKKYFFSSVFEGFSYIDSIIHYTDIVKNGKDIFVGLNNVFEAAEHESELCYKEISINLSVNIWCAHHMTKQEQLKVTHISYFFFEPNGVLTFIIVENLYMFVSHTFNFFCCSELQVFIYPFCFVFDFNRTLETLAKPDFFASQALYWYLD